MASNLFYRLRTATVAVVFLGAAGFAGEEVHECSHHGPRSVEGSGVPTSLAPGAAQDGGHPEDHERYDRQGDEDHRGSHQGHGDHGHHGHQVSASADADEGATHQHDAGDPCTCVGDCHGSAAAPVPASAPRATVPSVLVSTVSDLSTSGRTCTGPTPYVIPFPNPPPHAL